VTGQAKGIDSVARLPSAKVMEPTPADQGIHTMMDRSESSGGRGRAPVPLEPHGRHAGKIDTAPMEAPSYVLVCNCCGRRFPAGGDYLLDCCAEGMLVAEYPRLQVRDHLQGLWRFTDWLPVEQPGAGAIGGSTFRSETLGALLGLDDLWVAFNGWWPERGAHCPTCSFKDLEVAPTLQRLVEAGAAGVIVATAGNTGRAFADLGAGVGFPVVVVTAKAHVDRIWRSGKPTAPTTAVVGIANGDYNDAIEVASGAATRVGFELEGGVKNVARRDGIGTLLLDAVTTIGRMPDHYVQAVGGGPGPIGVWGVAERLAADGRFGGVQPRFHLAQNATHHPVHTAWQAQRATLEPGDVPAGGEGAYADVLVNRSPAYALRGGLHDLLVATRGQTYVVEAEDAVRWRATFTEHEGIDIMEAPAVALGALAQAVATGQIARDDCVLLSITGGGMDRLDTDAPLQGPTEVTIVPRSEAVDAVAEVADGLG
jgi:cysteate synthase